MSRVRSIIQSFSKFQRQPPQSTGTKMAPNWNARLPIRNRIEIRIQEEDGGCVQNRNHGVDRTHWQSQKHVSASEGEDAEVVVVVDRSVAF
jgi:hypothetical protein